MAQLIELGEDNRPSVQCPRCKQVVKMDIRPFEKDVTKVMKDKCPKCGTELFVCLLILVNSNLRLLYGAIQTVVEALNPQTLHKV